MGMSPGVSPRGSHKSGDERNTTEGSLDSATSSDSDEVQNCVEAGSLDSATFSDSDEIEVSPSPSQTLADVTDGCAKDWAVCVKNTFIDVHAADAKLPDSFAKPRRRSVPAFMRA